VTTVTMDAAKAEAFAGKMMGLLNQSFLSLLVSVGHRTGLYDEMAGKPARTAAEIARASRLNERYVQEWLGGVVVGGIVEYDAAAGTYRLPSEHAAFLTREAGQNNMAFFAQYVGLVAGVEKDVVRCFREGGGVPYSKFPEFQTLQGEESAALYDAQLVSTLVPFVPGIVERLQAGISVADVGCGIGHGVNVLARAFPRSRFVGLDFSEEAVGLARAEAAQMQLGNARFEVCDAARALPASYDFVTAFDTIHDQAHPKRVLANIRAALKPGGAFLMMDIAASSMLEENLQHPMGPLLYTVSVFHCMAVSLAQGGEGLGTVWGEQKALAYLAEAGFPGAQIKRVEGDAFHVYFVAQV